MRLLIVTQYFHPENFIINQFAATLSEQGHDVVVLTGQPNYPTGNFYPGYRWLRPLRERLSDLEVIRVPIFPRRSGRWWQLALNYLSFVASATVFGLPRLRGRFDVCLAFCPSPITVAVPAIAYRFVRRTPVALWVQDLWPDSVLALSKSRNRLLRLALLWLVRWVYRHVDQIWVQSPAYLESIVANGGAADHVTYIPNWADDLYDCEGWDNVIPEALPAASIVFAGNLGRGQGLDAVLAAIEIARREDLPAHWIFVGDGSLQPWLEQEVRARSLSDRVTLLPRRPPAEMPSILKASSALLVTLSDEEVFTKTIPSKVQSCLAAGRPVIGALSGEPARIIMEAQCGYVCPPGDPLGIADAARRVLTLQKEERERLGSSGHAYYRTHFTQRQVISNAVRLLEGLQHNRGQNSALSKST